MPGRPRTVHPRWRGEHLDSDRPGRADAGSSPLARGTHLCFIVEMVGNRFIPAGAGNTAICIGVLSAESVHPRWRGEHGVLGALMKEPDGSSPLARGTLLHCRRRADDLRFIPAGAGNTEQRIDRIRLAMVHPRWRGEHRRPAGWLAAGVGSSPLARGTLPHKQSAIFENRFIPAGAGNTPITLNSTPGISVHPRWRGEHT